MSTYSAASSYTTGSTGTPSESAWSEYEYPSSETSETEIIELDSASDTDTTITVDDSESCYSRAHSVDSSVMLLATVRGTTPAVSIDGEGKEHKVKAEAKPKVRRAGALRKLSESEQTQIVMLREKGWTLRAIAEVLDCSVNTVNSFCFRRRQKMNKLIATLPGAGSASNAQGARSGTTRGRRAGVKNERDVGIGGSRFIKKDEP
ncbi:hypothetical protein PANT_9d00048 [Moesziomyces antarcticus T-34]|uniref:RNA polymerase sigma factor 70 region 4 type 2 domain-containing protein n=1 Tax=Pseudozyma antarctica (strain T-34) TaxID=1151754 RepID=M9LUZ0_PSEA3|nr:hypothetical protein PANT_9d00048 [Moesziomyces antarcticus T-34]